MGTVNENISVIKRLYCLLVSVIITCFLGCSDDADENGIDPGESTRHVFFVNDMISEERTAGESLRTTIRYVGPTNLEDVKVGYTVVFPSSNAMVEGEDFEFSSTLREFTLPGGRTSTVVTLIDNILANPDATENRSMIFELDQIAGFSMTDPNDDGGSSVEVVIEPAEDTSSENDPDDFIGDKKFFFSEGANTYKVPYFANIEDIVNTNNTAITRAVIAMHGATHNAGSTFDNMMTAADLISNQQDTLLVVSPQFVGEEELVQFNLDEEHIYWSGFWRIGNTSRNTDQNPRPDRISSFTVMDSLMIKLSEYPNLKTIVLTGHSAGGQFANRYSASSPIVDELEARGVDISFIVNNPSSYVYMDNKRRPPGASTFQVPNVDDCPAYNEYRYGLDDLPTYLRNIGGAETIIQRLPQRKVTYLVGDNDNDPNANLLDVSCEAQLQGNHRFERGVTYFDHLLEVYGPTIETNQKFGIVPDVGHSSLGMFLSEIGLQNTFRN